jgi:hypothetical protein
MSKLRSFGAGGFAVVVELKPPKGTAVADMLAPVSVLKNRVAAFAVPDNEHARMRLAPVASARLVQDAGGEPLVLLTCRDRNRLALESDLLGAAVLGLENLLLVSGDYVTLGDHPQAKPVYDADSVQLQIARGLMDGHDSAGLPLTGSPAFFLGAVVIPEAEPLPPQLIKFEKKLAAGAQFFVTPAVFDLENCAGSGQPPRATGRHQVQRRRGRASGSNLAPGLFPVAGLGATGGKEPEESWPWSGRRRPPGAAAQKENRTVFISRQAERTCS